MNKTTLKTLAVVCASLFVTACSSTGASGGFNSAMSAFGNTSANASSNTSSSNSSSSSDSGSSSSSSSSRYSSFFDSLNKATSSNTSSSSNTSTSNNTSSNTATDTSANSGNTSTATDTSSNSGSTTTPVVPPSTDTTTVSGSKTGTALIGNVYNTYNSAFQSANSDSFDSITIDGKTIALTDSGTVGSLFTEIKGVDASTAISINTTASGTYFSYLRFGGTAWVNGYTGEQRSYDYVIGDVTPISAMPTSGTATYKGLSLVSNVGGGAWSQGSSAFDVDFGKKTISGKVDSFPYALALSGNINGASFSGTKDGISMQGNFYGSKAEELGGVFKGSVIDSSSVGTTINNFTGSFGAKKQ